MQLINRSYKLFRISFVLLASSLLFSCGGGGGSSSGGDVAQSPAAPTATPRSVAAIGDSISTGFGLAMPWPPRLAEILGSPVNNNSISGEQTDFGVRTIDEVIDRVQPTHIVILLGTNDALRGSVPNAIANLQSMVDTARGRNVIPIVGTLPPITRSASENNRAAQISDGIRNLSGAVVAEVRGALGNGSGLLADGLHPNDAGQQQIAETFASVF